MAIKNPDGSLWSANQTDSLAALLTMRKTMQAPKNIVVFGKTFFNTSGHTVFSARIWVDGQEVEGISYAQGSGVQYLWESFDKLESLNLIPSRERHEQTGAKESPYQYCERRGIQLIYSSARVGRRKDLF